jgi:phosphate uptake regulator
MKRKIIVQGNSTYTVSLPKEWATRNSLKHGNEIEIVENDNAITILPTNKKKKFSAILLDFKDLDVKLCHSYIIGLYKAGFKEMEIINLNTDKIDKIEELIQGIIGFEIIEKTSTRLKIIDLGSSEEEVLEKAEMQIYWKLINMSEMIIEGLTHAAIKKMDLEINKLSFYTQKHLASVFASNPNNFLRYEKCTLLENIGDNFCDVIKFNVKSSKDNLRKISDIIKSIREFEYLENETECNTKLIKIKNELAKDIPELREIIKNLKSLLENIIARKLLFKYKIDVINS